MKGFEAWVSLAHDEFDASRARIINDLRALVDGLGFEALQEVDGKLCPMFVNLREASESSHPHLERPCLPVNSLSFIVLLMKMNAEGYIH